MWTAFGLNLSCYNFYDINLPEIFYFLNLCPLIFSVKYVNSTHVLRCCYVFLVGSYDPEVRSRMLRDIEIYKMELMSFDSRVLLGAYDVLPQSSGR